MRIFNSLNKTKYFIALALLLAFAVFVGPADTGETFVKPDFPVESDAFFDYADMCTAFIAPERTEFLGRYEGVRELKHRHNAVRKGKVLPAEKLLLEKYVNNVYATARIPYYAEVCKLLAQLIVIYMFMTDGKKRSYKLSYNQVITN